MLILKGFNEAAGIPRGRLGDLVLVLSLAAGLQ